MKKNYLKIKNINKKISYYKLNKNIKIFIKLTLSTILFYYNINSIIIFHFTNISHKNSDIWEKSDWLHDKNIKIDKSLLYKVKLYLNKYICFLEWDIL